MPGSETPSRRVILIGASNLTFAFPLVVNSLMRSLNGPFEIVAAHGHGRSFCQWSYVLHRGLPPIPDCGLWSAISDRPHVEKTWGLVTDVGNDLIYGVPVDRLFSQVSETFRRLHEYGAQLTFVRMPLERILMLNERRYRLVKQILFPGPTVPWSVISQRAIELDERVAAEAHRHGAAVLTPELAWYGVDPIHIRRSQRVTAWRKILESWSFPEVPLLTPPGRHFALRIWGTPPAERTYWSRTYLNSQPAWRSPAGATLSLY
ncbi:hypothetical protein SH661x_004021 [Planctomicrobium sp. SH661]|uniref:hypothetical protein n=1 Tax=Planctomicrobium sp. SH661 TaxID=3448124 RepID=UPI003F5C38FA